MSDLELAVRLGVKDADRFKAAMRGAGAEVARFHRDANGRLRRGKFVGDDNGGGFLGGGGKKPPELGKRITEFGSKMEDTGRAVTRNAAVTGLALASLTKPVLDYEKAIMDAVAVTGDAVSNMANEQRLRGLTRNFTGMGYAATDVAEAVGYMGMAGMRTNQIMGSMAPTLQLAKAGSLDVARTTDLATDVVTSFGLEMGSVTQATKSMTRAADVMTYTFTSANTTLDYAARSLFAIGALAPQVGLSLESMAGAVGVLGSAGIKAEKAGTGIRNMILRISAPKTPAREQFKAMGLDPKKVQEAFARDDFAGGLKLIGDAMSKKNYSGAKRTKALDAIFGNRTTVQGAYLIKQAQSGVLQKQIEATRASAGVTKTIADKKSAGEAAKVAAMKAELEQMTIDLGTKVLPGLLPVAREIVESLKSVAEYAEKHPATVAWTGKWLLMLSAIGIVGGPALSAMGGMVKISGSLVSMANASKAAAANAAAASSAAAGGFTAVGGAATAAAGNVSKFRSAIGAAPLWAAAAGAAFGLGTAIGSLVDDLTGFSSEISGINIPTLAEILSGQSTSRTDKRGAGILTAEEQASMQKLDAELATLKPKKQAIYDAKTGLVKGYSEEASLSPADLGRKADIERRKAGIAEAARLRTERETQNFEQWKPKLEARVEEIDALKKEVQESEDAFSGMKGNVGGVRRGDKNIYTRRDKIKTSAWAELQRKKQVIESKELALQSFAERANIGLGKEESVRQKLLKVKVDVDDKRVTAKVVSPDAGMLSF